MRKTVTETNKTTKSYEWLWQRRKGDLGNGDGGAVMLWVLFDLINFA